MQDKQLQLERFIEAIYVSYFYYHFKGIALSIFKRQFLYYNIKYLYLFAMNVHQVL
jgi:hypothetical protein